MSEHVIFNLEFSEVVTDVCLFLIFSSYLIYKMYKILSSLSETDRECRNEIIINFVIFEIALFMLLDNLWLFLALVVSVGVFYYVLHKTTINFSDTDHE